MNVPSRTVRRDKELPDLLPIPGATVERVCFDYQCRVTFSDGPGVVLESRLHLVTGPEDYHIDPDNPRTVAPLLRILHDRLRSATVSERGDLLLTFASGIQLRAPADEQFEAWHVVHSDGRQVTSTPGGRIEIVSA